MQIVITLVVLYLHKIYMCIFYTLGSVQSFFFFGGGLLLSKVYIYIC